MNVQEEFSSATRSAAAPSNYYYWCDGERIPLTVNQSKVFVLVETSRYESAVKSATINKSKLGNVRLEEDYASLGIAPTSKNYKTRTGLTSFTLDNSNFRSIETDDLVYAAPYYKTNDGADIGITNIFSVRLRSKQDIAKLEKLAEENRLNLLGENQFDPYVYYLSCTKESQGNSLEMANIVYESGDFEYATPEFIIESSGAYTYSDNPYFSSQWNLRNTTYPGIDINYVNAQSMVSTANLNNVIVAVVDNGVWTHHNDLPVHNVSYNAHTGLSPSQVYGNHGTRVAGVIGANSNNNIGIAGVASGAKIMPISICYSSDADRLGMTASTTTHFANAIRYAANNGARVINNSWSFNTSSPIPDINDAITHAHGKGCVMVFSSGNSNAGLAVKQPAAGTPSETLVVGAITTNGNRASFSCYGSSLDVVAPGVGIWTTDWTGDYYDPDGTSFAAPQVAGIAALLFAAYPNLTRQQVADAIIKTAKLYPTKDTYRGYGLVDAYAALSAFRPPILYLSPYSPSGQAMISVTNSLADATYDWELNGTIIASYGPSQMTIPLPNYASSTVRVRSRFAGVVSNWSNTMYLYPPYAPAPRQDEEDTETDEEEEDAAAE